MEGDFGFPAIACMLTLVTKFRQATPQARETESKKSAPSAALLEADDNVDSRGQHIDLGRVVERAGVVEGAIVSELGADDQVG